MQSLLALILLADFGSSVKWSEPRCRVRFLHAQRDCSFESGSLVFTKSSAVRTGCYHLVDALNGLRGLCVNTTSMVNEAIAPWKASSCSSLRDPTVFFSKRALLGDIHRDDIK